MTGFKLKYDTSGVDRTKSATLPPEPGAYRMKITEASHVPAKGTNGEHLLFVVRMLENDVQGKGKNYGFWDRVYLTEASAWRVDQYLVAVGQDTTKKAKGTMTEATFLNKDVTGRVISGTYEGAYRPELKAVFPPMALGDDDEDDAEDGDEDDEDGAANEPDEPDDDEEEDDEDDEEEDDEEDEGDEPEDTYEYLNGMDRAALKQLLIAEGIVFKVVKSTTDDAIRTAIIAALSAKSGSAADADEEDEDEEEDDDASEAPDYSSWDREKLVAELKERKLSIKGNNAEKIARLRESDEDPFSE